MEYVKRHLLKMTDIIMTQENCEFNLVVFDRPTVRKYPESRVQSLLGKCVAISEFRLFIPKGRADA